MSQWQGQMFFHGNTLRSNHFVRLPNYKSFKFYTKIVFRQIENKNKNIIIKIGIYVYMAKPINILSGKRRFY
ncbi:hypothetical protein QTP88_026209 [Uroleucon formosanum]